MELRQADELETRERIDGYLQRSGLAARSPRVVPLTGDASDRRYFRVLLPDAPSIVLALYSAPFDVRIAAVRERRDAARADAGADPDRARPRRRSRRARAAGSRRRHAAGAPRRRDAGRARRALPPGGRADRDAAAPRRRAGVARVPAVRHRVRRREADVGAGLLHQALPRGVSRRRRSRRPSATALRGGVRGASSASWRRSRACCATATITAAT